MSTKLFQVKALIVLLVIASLATAAPLRKDERIVRDPVTGDYTAYYWAEDEQDAEMVVSSFITATKIEPTVRSTITLIENGKIRYKYKIWNGSKARQPIGNLELYELPINTNILNTEKVKGSDQAVLIEFFENSLMTPNSKWSASGARTEKAVNIDWLYDSWSATARNFDKTLGIRPGESLDGFGFTSSDLPSVWVAKLYGNTWPHQFNFSGEGPDHDATDIARQMSEIVANDFVPRNVAAPLVSIPNPFDAAVLLDRIRSHVATWPSKQLVDAAFASQLDRYLGAAADAYRLNNAKAGKEHIETIRELLEHEHKHLDHDEEDHDDGEERKVATRFTIDRLAARVLDFDLRYVLKRMEHDEDEHKKR